MPFSDAILAQDKTSRVAAEDLVKKTSMVVLAAKSPPARGSILRSGAQTVKRIGYNDPTIGFDTHTCTVIVR